MLSQYSNYDSDEIIFGVKKGGLNGKQELRPQPQQIIEGAGLLVSTYCDISGLILIEYTNIIQEPYSFSESYVILPNTIRTFVSPIKAQFFRVRFRNTETDAQTILKLNTYILTKNQFLTLDFQSSFSVDGNFSILTNIKDSSGNTIQIDSSGNLHTHNVYTANSSAMTFSVVGTTISSTSVNLGEYKNFDVLLESITANNVYPVILDIYVSKDDITYIKSNYNVVINFGDSATGVLNCVSNSPYIKLSGTTVTGLTLTSGVIYMKG